MTASSFYHPSFFFIAAALIIPFLKGESWWRWLTPIPAIAAFISVISVDHGMYGHIQYLGQSLLMGRVDTLSLVFAHVFAIQAFIGIIYAFHVKEKAHHVASMLYVAGSFGCTFAGDFLTLFIFWELMAVASTFLVWLRRNPISTQAGFRYLMFHIFGGLFLLGGLLLRFKAVGNFTFDHVMPADVQLYDYLIMIGFCVNAATIPLHAWLPDAYPEATVPGAVFMCAFTTKTAVYVLARGFFGFEILAIAGTIMAVYGVLYACIENDCRRILSYHIISQVGYMVAGIGVGTAMTVNGAVAHAYAHILYKGLLFMGAGCLLYAAGTSKLTELGGLVGRIPWVMILYMVGAVSISGMPFFNGFVSKNMTILGAVEAHHIMIGVFLEVAAVGTFLSVGIKLPYFAFFAKPENNIELKPIPANMYIAMAIAASLCLAQGLFPNILYCLLPHPVHFEPYTRWTLLQASMLLSFTGLGFYLLRKVIVPHAGRNFDFNIIYKLIGQAFVNLVCKPIAFFDGIWTEVYRTVGMRGIMGAAFGTRWFDVKGIDTVVDGSAYTVRGIGRISARLQTGRLQDYLAWASVAALVIYAVVWWNY
ncbi:NADH/Ubiquinone/plastoquinone (Complex I) [uncultured Desulfobacterium sp.]|uniref:NADH/Ubiquinone/plastoquinone (Complex I) n=1 Tax=uncultured Desulfobacterium sp. TaxID=201089 RepID=A0A445MRZ8_9BACT|nr:NADH/Ubiquinone/plastoquinone (Complex I) [uncultured Desulfobacterium sp.]